MNFSEFLSSGSLVMADGAMGTSLQASGLEPGAIPEEWSITHKDVIRSIHRSYFDAGADFVLSNTFGANALKYHGACPLDDIVAESVALAREAAEVSGGRFVALDVGPTGRLVSPSSADGFEMAYEAFAREISVGAKCGADLIVIETMGDVYELKAAVLAAKENSSLPVIASVALDASGKMLTGADVETFAALLDGLRVDAIGLNCGLGPSMMLPHLKRLVASTNLPVMVKPNAGLPAVVNGRTVFPSGPEEFARDLAELAGAGALILGGCCGTTPGHIAAARRALGKIEPPVRKPQRLKTFVTSLSRAVEIPLDDSIIIGERINPTGKKALREAYRSGDVDYILREAVAQADAGSHILDVNAGVPGIDEVKVLADTVLAVQGVVNVPLQIDTSNPAAMERAMRMYAGKCLVNSVNGKKESMDAVFPLVAKYGGVVVALTLDEDGIPPTAEGRLAVARKIIDEGARYGLGPDDFVVDVLCLSVSADPRSANVILESMKLVRRELGVRTALGVSNVSFGLPERAALNASFYTLALQYGLSAGIVNPLSGSMMVAYRSFRALTGRDGNCAAWISFAEGRSDSASRDVPAAPAVSSLADAIRRGLKNDAAAAAKSLLDGGAKPIEVIDGHVVTALENVGALFESGKFFLPQLLMAADAASAAFGVLREELARSGASAPEKGPVILATVKGDIHDIGKNIVRSLLENYGFRVIDLGRDVEPAAIVEAALAHRCRLVGLSALMTTTVGFMAESIAALKKADPSIETIVGGAVLTEEYAREIGATWYAKDAMATVRIAESFFGGANAVSG